MQIIPIADEFFGGPVDIVISGVRDEAVGCGGDGGGFATGKGREIPDADVADEIPVGGAGKGVDIRGFDAEKADERLLLLGGRRTGPESSRKYRPRRRRTWSEEK